jgi:hypothetical protein
MPMQSSLQPQCRCYCVRKRVSGSLYSIQGNQALVPVRIASSLQAPLGSIFHYPYHAHTHIDDRFAPSRICYWFYAVTLRLRFLPSQLTWVQPLTSYHARALLSVRIQCSFHHRFPLVSCFYSCWRPSPFNTSPDTHTPTTLCLHFLLSLFIRLLRIIAYHIMQFM